MSYKKSDRSTAQPVDALARHTSSSNFVDNRDSNAQLLAIQAKMAEHTIATQYPSVIQGAFAKLGDVKNKKFIPTAGFTDTEKLEIANWCNDDNNGSNAIRSPFLNTYKHHTAENANNHQYTFQFNWDLASHLDLGGAAHGSVDTPHLQAVQGLHGFGTQTESPVAITKDNVRQPTLNLKYNDPNNAVALSFQETKNCMDEKSILNVRDKLYPKLKSFAETWARNFADKDSGAKKLREQEDPMEGLSLWNSDNSE